MTKFLVDDKICSKRLFIISILFWQAKWRQKVKF